jgi:hypothetical protein
MINGDCPNYPRKADEGKALRDERFRLFFDFLTRQLYGPNDYKSYFPYYFDFLNLQEVGKSDELLVTRLVAELNKCTSKHSFDAIIATEPTGYAGLRLVTLYRSSCFRLVDSYPLKMQVNGEIGQYGMCLVFEDLRTRRILTMVNI